MKRCHSTTRCCPRFFASADGTTPVPRSNNDPRSKGLGGKTVYRTGAKALERIAVHSMNIGGHPAWVRGSVMTPPLHHVGRFVDQCKQSVTSKTVITRWRQTFLSRWIMEFRFRSPVTPVGKNGLSFGQRYVSSVFRHWYGAIHRIDKWCSTQVNLCVIPTLIMPYST